MSVVSHHSSPWDRLRAHLAEDDFATTVVFFLIAIVIAVAWFAPVSFTK